jgi:hypothetical protein
VRAVLRAVLRVMKPKLLATFAGTVGFCFFLVRLPELPLVVQAEATDFSLVDLT